MAAGVAFEWEGEVGPVGGIFGLVGDEFGLRGEGKTGVEIPEMYDASGHSRRVILGGVERIVRHDGAQESAQGIDLALGDDLALGEVFGSHELGGLLPGAAGVRAQAFPEVALAEA